MQFRRRLVALLTRWAQQAPTASAAGRWRWVVVAEEQPSARSMLAWGKALVAAEAYDRASDVLGRARRLYPDNVHLATNWAQAATEQQDWAEAAARWKHVVDQHGPTAPARAWARWADALRRTGRPASALDVIERARDQLGLQAPLVVIGARCHAQLGDADAQAALWRTAIVEQDWEVPAFGYRSLAYFHRKRNEVAAAIDATRRGLDRHADDPRMRSLRAELAMVQHDWPAALVWWAAFLESMDSGSHLPEMRGGSDWHAGDWVGLADWVVQQGEVPEPLRNGPLAEELVRVLSLSAPAAAVEVAAWLDDLGSSDDDVVEHGCRAAARVGRRAVGSATTDRSATVAQIEEVVRDELARSGPTGVARVDVDDPRLGTELRAARWVDLDEVRGWLRDASPLPWLPPEPRRASDILDRVGEAVEQVVAELGRGTAVPGDVLREALQLPLWHLTLLRAPLEDLADHLAGQSEDGVLLLPAPDDVRVFDPLDLTGGWQLLLAAALRARGSAVALVHDIHDTEASTLTLGVGRTLLRGREPQRAAPRGRRPEALFPSGIRSLVEVIERIGDPLVLTGDAIVSAFAYDRTLSAVVDYRPQVSVLPDTELLESGPLRTERAPVTVDAATIDAVDPGRLRPTELVDQLLLPPLEDMWRRSVAIVEEYGVERAHVADHLYPGSAVFAGAVRSAGGDVALWPHSTNPVHATERRPGTVDHVTAVLESGATQWRSTHPGATTSVASELMLDWDDVPTPVDPSSPLNVVLIGGTTTLGLTTYVDPDHHEAAHRALIDELRQLSEAGSATIWCKPKGGLAEGMWWLEGVVGDIEWLRPMQQHPRRIDLPNLVFVTVSLGSSAIYEGIMRGIPGMVARLRDVEDYTTVRDGAVPVAQPHRIGELLRRCVDPSRRASLLAAQVALVEDETGTTSPWSGRLTS